MKLLFALLIIFAFNDFSTIKTNTVDRNALLGTWLSAEKDLKIEVNSLNDSFSAKIIWFKCEPNGPKMEAYKDINNPITGQRDRTWLGMNVLENLNFNAKGYWENGKIYDPNSGRKYSAIVRLKNLNYLTVRGYWGLEIFGKTLNFTKIK